MTQTDYSFTTVDGQKQIILPLLLKKGEQRVHTAIFTETHSSEDSVQLRLWQGHPKWSPMQCSPLRNALVSVQLHIQCELSYGKLQPKQLKKHPHRYTSVMAEAHAAHISVTNNNLLPCHFHKSCPGKGAYLA